MGIGYNGGGQGNEDRGKLHVICKRGIHLGTVVTGKIGGYGLN
jgi:hypothetical protein